MLFGMMNWTFTWLRAGGTLSHADLAPFVTGLFLRGLNATTPEKPPKPPTVAVAKTRRKRRLAANRTTAARLTKV
jgi:hypothetical protein